MKNSYLTIIKFFILLILILTISESISAKKRIISKNQFRPVVDVCTPPPSGLVSWWAAENNALDSRIRNNGTLFNGASFTNGKVGRGFSFNGANQYIEIPDSPSLQPSGELTLEGWFRFNSATDTGTLISKGGSWYMYVIGNSVIVIVDNSVVLQTAFQRTTENWFHIAYTFNQPTLSHRIYVNGELVSALTQNANLNYNSTPFRIGIHENNSGLNTPFNGDADEVAIYNRALSQTEIQSIYNSQTAGKCRICTAAPVGLVGWWTGDGNSFDIRGGNNATLVNGISYAGGIGGGSFYLDGANSYALIGNSVPSILQIQNEITLDAWIYLTEYPGDTLGLIIGSQYDITASGATIFIDGRTNPDGQPSPPGHIHFQIGDGSWHTTNTQTQVPLNQWVHIAATRKASEDAKIYYNGVSQPLSSYPWSGSISYNGAWFSIGQQKDINRPFKGYIDEVQIFNRALSESEVQSIALAGSAGKCKPTATISPSGLVSWWSGDGDTRDSVNTNNGTIQGNVTYSIGKTSQGFQFGGTGDLNGNGDRINIGNPANLQLQDLTIETWVKRSSSSLVTNSPFPGFPNGIFFAYGQNGYGIGIEGAGKLFLTNVGNTGAISNLTVTDTNWHHVAVTKFGNQVVFYVDGVSETQTYTTTFSFTTSAAIGARGDNNVLNAFYGAIDEVSIYNRALSASEIQSIYNSGIAGKLKNVTTATGYNRKINRPNLVNTTVGDVLVSFPSVSVAGITQQIPLSTDGLPLLPNGYAQTGLIYDVATSAIYSGSPIVCFNLPSLSSQFTDLRVLHLENGEWINQTDMNSISPNLCTTSLNSLSPFAIVKLAPTAASISISGRVLTTKGRGIARVSVTLTDSNGNTQKVLTNQFGRYSFEELEIGHSYIISVSSRNHYFSESTKVLFPTEVVENLDFVADW